MTKAVNGETSSIPTVLYSVLFYTGDNSLILQLVLNMNIAEDVKMGPCTAVAHCA